jgi:hypothetical protein
MIIIVDALRRCVCPRPTALGSSGHVGRMSLTVKIIETVEYAKGSGLTDDELDERLHHIECTQVERRHGWSIVSSGMATSNGS